MSVYYPTTAPSHGHSDLYSSPITDNGQPGLNSPFYAGYPGDGSTSASAPMQYPRFPPYDRLEMAMMRPNMHGGKPFHASSIGGGGGGLGGGGGGGGTIPIPSHAPPVPPSTLTPGFTGFTNHPAYTNIDDVKPSPPLSSSALPPSSGLIPDSTHLVSPFSSSSHGVPSSTVANGLGGMLNSMQSPIYPWMRPMSGGWELNMYYIRILFIS